MDFKIAKNPDLLLEAMQDHEKAIAYLYQAYSERFEEYADFWADLAKEERKHAVCFRNLRLLIQKNPDIVIVERFSIDAVNFSIKYVNELTERAGDPEFELINAFSLAAKLEEALLEKNFFEVLSGDAQEIKDTLLLLASETERHFQTLKSTLNDYKASNP